MLPALETWQVPTTDATGMPSQAVLQHGVTDSLWAWGDVQHATAATDGSDGRNRKLAAPTPYSLDGVSPISVTMSGATVLGCSTAWGTYSAQQRGAPKILGVGGPWHAFHHDPPSRDGTPSAKDPGMASFPLPKSVPDIRAPLLRLAPTARLLGGLPMIEDLPSAQDARIDRHFV
jgi:hypothetical protein